MSKKNNILIISPLFNPEMNRVNDIVNYLLEKNNNITVLCPIPNYPKGRYFKNYGIFKKRYEKFDNLKIFRILVYPRKDGSKLNLFLNYLSFIVFSIIPAIILSFKKFDLIRITATVFEKNIASAKVLEKCNFVLEGACLKNYYIKEGKVFNAKLYALTK